jgi:phosphoglycolate phosphatase-like HAD superfamily hydrolase
VKLLLWDIDGTLIHGGGVAGVAMRAAMERVYGRPATDDRRSYAGKTDQQIILETFSERSAEELLRDLAPFTQAYLVAMEASRGEFEARARVLPGVVPALQRLQAEPVVLSLLTGNLLPVARLKLELLGLAHFFDFDAGAYGSDHHRRAALAPIAAGRAARRYGRAFAGRDIVVIGDTPFDIECGRAAGARTVAVATGPFSAEELRAHRPDAVLADLANTDAALRAILG